ncbi:hypothetical protein Tco_0987089 [Tanacetum coccineum]
MRTRSQSRNSNRQQQVNPTFIEPFNLVEPIENQAPPVVTMDDTRTMAQLLEAPTVGYEDAIVVPKITADNFELKHDHFYNEVLERIEYVGKAYAFPIFSQGFLRSAWTDSMILLVMPHHGIFGVTSNSILHGFLELHQLDTFYNALNSNDQDSLNSAAGVSSSSSTPGISPDVAELKDMMKALLLDKKSQAPTPVKAVEESCVTCGGTHSYRNCPTTDGNVYRDNIQEYVSQAATANFNQGNTGYRASIANQIRPPMMRNMQDQNQNLQNQMTNLTDMLSKFVNSNIASTSGSWTLPSNTITNPKVDLKGITTRSGVAYQGPTIPTTSSSPPKVVERELEVTKDAVPPTNNGSTKDVQPPVVQVQSQVPNSKPVVDPVSALMPNPKPSIPYPSRRNDERRHEKANDQIEKFYKIFQDMSFEISLADALILMP